VDQNNGFVILIPEREPAGYLEMAFRFFVVLAVKFNVPVDKFIETPAALFQPIRVRNLLQEFFCPLIVLILKLPCSHHNGSFPEVTEDQQTNGYTDNC